MADIPIVWARKTQLLAGRALMLLVLVALGLAGMSRPVAAEPLVRPVIYTTNYPLEYFASRIAGELAVARFPGPAGVDPSSWVPEETTLLGYHQADLILLNGAGYERWTTTISLPVNRTVNTTRSLAENYISSTDQVTHTHGPQGEHVHDNLAFTTWLDLRMAASQAGSIAAALVALMPGHEEVLMHNLAALVTDLDQLDRALQSISDRFGNQPLLGSHPVYQYFSARYAFDVKNLHWEPAETPPPAEWQKLEVLLERHPAQWMIWEAPPAPATTRHLARLGITPLVFYPLGNRPADGDFLSVMQHNIAGLELIAEGR